MSATRRSFFLLGASGVALAACNAEGDAPVTARATPAPAVRGTALNQATRRPAPRSVPTENGLTLIYVSAWNCPVCPGFEFSEMRPFLASPEAARMAYRNVSVPAYQAPFTTGGYWPADLEWLRTEMYEGPTRRGGTPRTILIRQQTILATAFGGTQWRAEVYPRIVRELATA